MFQSKVFQSEIFQNNLFQAITNNSGILNNCIKKLVLFLQKGQSIEVVFEDNFFKYFEDERFDVITAITFSSSIKTAFQLVKKFKEINLYIGLSDDYSEINRIFNDFFDDYKEKNKKVAEEILKMIENEKKKVSVYVLNNSHAKIYFLSSSRDASVKRGVILSSANLSEVALKGNQMEHFVIIDDEKIYDEIYTFFDTKIKPNANLVIDNRKEERFLKDFLKENKDLVIAIVKEGDIKNSKEIKDLIEKVGGSVIDFDKLLQNEKMTEKFVDKLIENEEMKKTIFQEIVKKEDTKKVLIDKLEEEIKFTQVINLAKDSKLPDVINYLEEQLSNENITKIKERKQIFSYLLKKRDLPEARLKEEIRTFLFSNFSSKDQYHQYDTKEFFRTRYSYDIEKKSFVFIDSDKITYDMDKVKRDVEILNRFMEAYSFVDGEFKQERYWIVSMVLLFGFSSFYISFLRYFLKNSNFRVFESKGTETYLFEIVPVFCFLVGTAESGKTLLLTLLSKLFDKKIVSYQSIEETYKNNRDFVIRYYLTCLRDIAPFLIDEVKPSDISENKNFGRAIKTYSNDPFSLVESFIPQGNIFLAANLENLNPEKQITRRILFFYFKASVKDSKKFRQKIIETGFNSLTSEISRYYISWLNEHLDYIDSKLNEIVFKANLDIKDTLGIAYEFLRSIGVQVSMDFPENFGSYEYFIKKFWRNLYLYHRESLFIEKEDKIMVSKEKIENYIKPSPYFHIEEASTKDTYVFDKKKFLEYIEIDHDSAIEQKYLDTGDLISNDWVSSNRVENKEIEKSEESEKSKENKESEKNKENQSSYNYFKKIKEMVKKIFAGNF